MDGWQRASGSIVVDSVGRPYLDLTSGAIVSNAGHAHPAILEALSRLLARPLIHCYKYEFTERIRLTDELLHFAGGQFTRVALTVTGSEAIELALRICWRHGRKVSKPVIVSFDGSFHGKTLGAATLGGITRYQWGPAAGDCGWNIHLPYPSSVAALRVLLARLAPLAGRVIGIVLECVQGSTLERITPEAMASLRRWCWEHGALLVFDEIQTGFHRAGPAFGFFDYDILPDLLCVGKGLTSSLPLSAVLLAQGLDDDYDPDLDSSTHMANPLSVAAALACLEIYQSTDFLANLRAASAEFSAALAALGRSLGSHAEARLGGGLLGGLWFDDPTSMDRDAMERFLCACRMDGVLLGPPVGEKLNLVKMTPPLVISPQEIQTAFAVLARATRAAGWLP
jgi:4-aminobutyrate aminotransferase/(S)-3-amino-2-methylpropionate transaminase